MNRGTEKAAGRKDESPGGCDMFSVCLGFIAFAPMVILYHTNLPSFNVKGYQTMSFTAQLLGDFQCFTFRQQDRATLAGLFAV